MGHAGGRREATVRCARRGQRKFGLRLPSPEVQMIEVARNFLIQGGQRAVYEKVMVAAIGPGIPCGDYFYPARAKP